jgi:hypothetical protein
MARMKKVLPEVRWQGPCGEISTDVPQKPTTAKASTANWNIWMMSRHPPTFPGLTHPVPLDSRCLFRVPSEPLSQRPPTYRKELPWH